MTTSKRGVKIRIVQNEPTAEMPDFDSQQLSIMGAADVRNLNMTKFMRFGVLHTKLWIVDSKHFYMGSANMDWRSLTQVRRCIYTCRLVTMLCQWGSILGQPPLIILGEEVV